MSDDFLLEHMTVFEITRNGGDTSFVDRMPHRDEYDPRDPYENISQVRKLKGWKITLMHHPSYISLSKEECLIWAEKKLKACLKKVEAAK